MARELILIGDIQIIDEKVCFAGAYIGEGIKPPKKENLLKRRIIIKSKEKDIGTTIESVFINHTLSDVYVIAIGTGLSGKKGIQLNDIVCLEE